MKFRKKIAALLAVALVMTMLPMTVLAADVTTTSENSTGTISGNVNYVDTTIYLVTLPTTSNMNFALDPQGLSALIDGGDAEAAAGGIVASSSMYAVNYSSVPIKLSAKFSITDSDKTASTKVNIVSQNTLVSANKTDLFIAIAPGTEEGISANSYVSSNFVSVSANFIAITGVTEEAPTEVLFQLDKADYEFKYISGNQTYTYEKDTTVSDNYDCVYFKLDGSVGKDADWSDFTDGSETLQINAVFSFTELASYEAAAMGVAGTDGYGLVTDASLLAEATDEANSSVATIATTTYPAATGNIAIAITLNGETFKNVYFPSGSKNLTSGTHYSYANGTLTLSYSGFLTTNKNTTVNVVFESGTSIPITIGTGSN